MTSRIFQASIVIPTFNRCSSIQGTLWSLNRQTCPKEAFEVIVVDDGSTDDTYQALQSISCSLSYELRILRCKRCGPGVARNKGLKAASGEIILFTDSDCEPDVDWVERMIRSASHPLLAIGGHIEAADDMGLTVKSVNYLFGIWLGGMGHVWRFYGFIPGYRLRTGNAAVHRATLESVNGFLCTGGYYGEDTELGERLLQHGVRLEHCPDAIVYHREQRTLINYCLEALARSTTTVDLIQKRAIPMRGIYALPSFLVLIFMGVLSGFASQSSFFLFCTAAFSVYALLLVCWSIPFSIRARRMVAILVFPFITFLLHITYGLGIFLGLLNLRPCLKESHQPLFWNVRKKNRA